jgi:uncharacterized protein involved in exopolysaccharide biosynthesis
VLKSNPTSALAAVAGLKAQVTAQEVKVGAIRGYLAETAPDFKQAMAELANLRAQLAKQEKDEPASAAGQGDYVAKFREFKYQETLFELFARQFEMAKVDESREGAVIQVLDATQPPERKSKPKKAIIAIIATLAAVFALLPSSSSAKPCVTPAKTANPPKRWLPSKPAGPKRWADPNKLTQ